MAIKVKTTAPAALLAAYNKAMLAAGEDIYEISADRVGDASAEILADTADEDGTDEVTVSAAYLVEEMRWNFTEKLATMAQEAYAEGAIEKAEYKRTVRGLHREYARFKARADRAEAVQPWLVTEI